MIKRIDYKDTYPIRQMAMYPDKPIEHVMMPIDPDGHHFGFYVDDTLVSVISLFDVEGTLQFRKFATLPDMQGRGYGSILLHWVFEYALNKDYHEIWCNARYDKRQYYARFGMVESDKHFERGGIPYVIMMKAVQ